MSTIRETLPDVLDGERLDRVVALLAGCSRAEAVALIDDGAVTVDGAVVAQKSTRLAEGQVVVLDYEPPDTTTPVSAEAGIEFAVIHVDDHFVVVDKPDGLVVHPGAGNDEGTLVNGLVSRWPDIATVGDPVRPGIVHRIDKGTSGLLVVARTQLAYDSLVEQFSSRSVEREYQALCWGAVEPSQGMIDAPIGRARNDPTKMAVSNQGRPARTRYEVVATFDEPTTVTHLSCRLETGRTHQIRVHLAAIGHPIVGDRRYGGNRPALTLDRPWLHAGRLGFVHPATGEAVEFESALPADLEAILAQLR